MRISDWSSDVCSSDLGSPGKALRYAGLNMADMENSLAAIAADGDPGNRQRLMLARMLASKAARPRYEAFLERAPAFIARTEERRVGEGCVSQCSFRWSPDL